MSKACIVGDENGVLRLVDCTTSGSATFGEFSREGSILGMSWNKQDENFFVLRKTSCELWNIVDGSLVMNYNVNCDDFSGITEGNGVCFLYSSKGSIFTAKSASNKIKLSKIFSSEEEINISDCKSCSDGLAFGGKETDLRFLDVQSGIVTWEAKNVQHDTLSLRVPVWIRSISFIDPSKDSISSGTVVVTGTAYKHVRLYDTRISGMRRPVHSLDAAEYCINTVSAGQNIWNSANKSEYAVYVGDCAGNFVCWDIRNNRKITSLKGGCSSVRTSVFAPVNNESRSALSSSAHIVTASIDRFIRIYSTRTNKLKHSVYVKTTPTSLLCCSDSCTSINLAGTEKPVEYSSDEESYDGSEDKLSDYDDSQDEEDDDAEESGEDYNESEPESEPEPVKPLKKVKR